MERKKLVSITIHNPLQKVCQNNLESLKNTAAQNFQNIYLFNYKILLQTMIIWLLNT